ncbi:MAG: hypothetical protein EOM65_17225, partial [Synergistales bacterium]|nr:hypothetical protein [Synergistales bacterium]
MNKRNFSPALLAFLAMLTLSGALFAEERTISLEECLALAEENHPALEEARAALAGQQAKLGQVRV